MTRAIGLPWFFSAWRPDQSAATRDRVWRIKGLDRLKYETDPDRYEVAYRAWADHCFVAVLDLADEDRARVAYRSLQAERDLAKVKMGHQVRRTYRVMDLVHVMDSMSWSIQTEGLQDVLTDLDTLPIRLYAAKILKAMDRRGWDEVDMTFH